MAKLRFWKGVPHDGTKKGSEIATVGKGGSRRLNLVDIEGHPYWHSCTIYVEGIRFGNEVIELRDGKNRLKDTLKFSVAQLYCGTKWVRSEVISRVVFNRCEVCFAVVLREQGSRKEQDPYPAGDLHSAYKLVWSFGQGLPKQGSCVEKHVYNPSSLQAKYNPSVDMKIEVQANGQTLQHTVLTLSDNILVARKRRSEDALNTATDVGRQQDVERESKDVLNRRTFGMDPADYPSLGRFEFIGGVHPSVQNRIVYAKWQAKGKRELRGLCTGASWRACFIAISPHAYDGKCTAAELKALILHEAIHVDQCALSLSAEPWTSVRRDFPRPTEDFPPGESDAYLGMFLRGGFSYGVSWDCVEYTLADGLNGTAFENAWPKLEKMSQTGPKMLQRQLYNEIPKGPNQPVDLIRMCYPGYDLYLRPPAR